MVRIVILALFSVILIFNVTCEPCSQDSDCHLASCSWGSHVVCVRGICTCVEFCSNEDATCQGRLQCVQNAQQHGCPCDETWHCIDNHCACGYPNINSTHVTYIK
ncbi:hypothetical protein SNE40_010237 [Patella caerulea]|uniref:Uncharacterized protein n=1 Tax=Patella caerulea TaxID=87958 RepID=A0AAN8JTU1_PATCE